MTTIDEATRVEVRYGEIEVEVTYRGIEPQGWNEPSTATMAFAYSVVVSDGETTYESSAWGSVHDYQNGRRDFCGLAGMVARELVDYWLDPNEFAYLLAEGIESATSLKRACSAMRAFEDAEPLAAKLYDWASGVDVGEHFEEGGVVSIIA